MHRTVFPPTNQFLSADSRRKKEGRTIVFTSMSQWIHMLNNCAKGSRKEEGRMSTCSDIYCVIRMFINVEHCGGEPEQAANMHMNRLSFMLK